MTFIGSTEFYYELAEGKIAGQFSIIKFGRNQAVQAAAREDVWDGGGTYIHLNAGERLNIQSSSIQDSSSGTGAQEVSLLGLDDDWNVISENIPTNGASNVLSVKTYFRFFRGIVTAAGTDSGTAGNITFTSETSGILQAQITNGTAQFNQTEMALMSIPNTYTGFLHEMRGSLNAPTPGASADPAATIEFYVRPEGEVFQLKDDMGLVREGSSFVQALYPIPLLLPEKSDTKIRVAVTDNNSDVSARYTISFIPTLQVTPSILMP